MEPRSELRGQLARASATLIASFALVAACVGDDPDSSSSSSSGGSSGASSGTTSSGATSSGTTSSGGSSGTDGGDAGVKKCDPSKDFEKVEDVPGLTNVLAKSPRLTPDEQTIYVHVIGPARLEVAKKINGMFGPLQDVLGVAPTTVPPYDYEDSYPAIGASDKVIFWGSTRAQNDVNISRIYTATRQATGTATAFTNPIAVSTLPNDANGPFVVGDGEVIYFWQDTGPVNKIFRAALVGPSYATPAEVDLGGGAEFPALSPDEQVIFFSTARGDGGGVEIYTAVRNGPPATTPFGTPKRVAIVNNPGVTNIASWVSADYCRLYFFRNEDQKLLVASRTPPP